MNRCHRIILPGMIMLICAWHTTIATAQEQLEKYDRFSLQAEAGGDVLNDLLTVELVVESEDRDSATLANRINADMQWAIERAKRYPSVKSSTRNYNTWPKYERIQNRIIGWHASQTLLLESDDFNTARTLIQTLQEKLQVRSMSMSAKPDTRTQQEDVLINQALDRFKARAMIIQQNMGAIGYRIVDVSINTYQDEGPYLPRMRATAMESSKVEEAPVIESGTSRVRVHIEGRIELN